MNPIKLLFASVSLFITVTATSQNCSPSFVYTVSPNGSTTFSNTSTFAASLNPVFTWDFGNGQTFSTSAGVPTVATTFTSNGTYTVILMVTGSNLLLCSGRSEQFISVMVAGCPLSASLIIDPPNYFSPVVSFTNASSGTVTGTTYLWEFGDGSTSTAISPSHTYMLNGTYGYSLSATNNATCTSFINVPWYHAVYGKNSVLSYSNFITVVPGAAGQVTMTANGIANAQHINWLFGDVTFDMCSGRCTNVKVTHTYFNGVYTPTVWFAIPSYGVFLTNVTFTINNNPCAANAAFTYTAMSGGVVQFAKTAPSNSNIAYTWDFGDGYTSALANPTHTYSSAGNHSVTLTAYHSAFPVSCQDVNTINLNITGIPCIANANFTINSMGTPHNYQIFPEYPYNVTAGVWSWGDNTTSNIMYTGHTYSAAGTYDVCLTITVSCGATATFCSSQYLARGMQGDMIYLTVLPPEKITGIEDNANENLELSLFPNPTTGILNLKLNQNMNISGVEIYDVLGNIVYQNNLPFKNEDTYQIETGTLSNGVYFLKVKSPQNTISKFIISK